MKRLLSTVTSILLVISLGGCGSDTKDEQDTTLTSGVELENMDTSVRPQDDFYNYVNVHIHIQEDISDKTSKFIC